MNQGKHPPPPPVAPRGRVGPLPECAPLIPAITLLPPVVSPEPMSRAAIAPETPFESPETTRCDPPTQIH